MIFAGVERRRADGGYSRRGWAEILAGRFRKAGKDRQSVAGRKRQGLTCVM